MISMKMPTFKNIDHSSRAIVGAVGTTIVPNTGNTENIEKHLENIYKELCAKELVVNVTYPELRIPEIKIPKLDQPNIVNNVEVKQEAQAVTFEVKVPKNLIIINILLSIIAIGVSIVAVLK